MAEAVRPKKKSKKKTSKPKAALSADVEEHPPLQETQGEDQGQKMGEEDEERIDVPHFPDDAKSEEPPGEGQSECDKDVETCTETSQSGDVEGRMCDQNDIEGDESDMDKWMEKFGDEPKEEESPQLKLKDEEFQEAVEYIDGGDEEVAISTGPTVAKSEMISMEQESSENDHGMPSLASNVAHGGEEATPGEGAPADSGLEEPCIEVDLADAECHDAELSSEREVTGEQDSTQDGLPSLGAESLEEFEILSPLSRETSVDESSSAPTGQATAPPLEDRTTLEASAPPTESTSEGATSSVSSIDQEVQGDITGEVQDVVAEAMRTAPLIPLSPEENPLSGDPGSIHVLDAAAERAVVTAPGSTREAAMRKVASRGPKAVWPSESMQPMTRLELRHYYHNSMLATQDAFVEDFVKGNYVDKHEFYELVSNYLRARNNVATIQAEVKAVQEDGEHNEKLIWSFHENEIPVKGSCEDDVNVKSTHKFKLVEYHQEKMKAVEQALTKFREHIHGTYALVTYTAQLSRLQIECYIYQLLSRSQLLGKVDDTMPVTAFISSPYYGQEQVDIAKLKVCIAILFAFQRKPISDPEFIEYSRAWLQRLVSVLLRVASLNDHPFIFNHLLRCPPGIGTWASAFLQVTAPDTLRSQNCDLQLLDLTGEAASSMDEVHTSHDSPYLDHFINMLATLMSPVRYREEFLAKMTVTSTNPFSPGSGDPVVNWTLVDEDLDAEDEEESHSLLLNESDLVELLSQFPFTEMFCCVLQVDTSADKSYNVENIKDWHILRLVAFSTTLIDIFRVGLSTFNRSRYRQFVKRIGRLIRHTVQYVADHWTNFRTWSVEVCRDSQDEALPSSNQERAISLQQIQLEVDEMFFRAVQCIMSSPRLGTWQFLADMPYSSLSPHMMWRLLWFLHHSDKGEVSSSASINVRTRAKLEEYKWDLSDSTKKEAFSNKLLNMPMSEVIYLLTTFANMASARSNEEADFVDSITTEVYELAYLNKHTRDSCSKVGRELLAGMALTHPFILTNIITLIQSSMDIIGSMSVYLCSELPLHLWQPSSTDIGLLRSWLLEHNPDSTENQLARLILSKMNWGFNEQEDELVLDITIHRKVAILVMEAFSKHIMEKQQSAFLVSTLSWGISIVLGDVVNLDVWCWDLLNKLCLHAEDQPIHAATGASLDQSQGHASKSAEAAGFIRSEEIAAARDFVTPDLNVDPILYPVNKALESKIPLACYIAVAMTKAGHNVDDFLTKGLEFLQNLVTSGCYRMCIPLIGKIVPTFIKAGQQGYLLTNLKFISLIETILNADNQYSRLLQKLSVSFSTECTALFSSMIATLLQASKARGCSPGYMEALFEFWLSMLTSCKNWHTNHELCQVLNTTLEAALGCHKASSILTQEVFMTHFRKKVSGVRTAGLLSSVISLVISPSPLPTMVEHYKKEFPWLAYSLMSAETAFLQESGVLQAVSQELHGNLSVTTDQAVKRVSQRMKNTFLMNVNQLPIYRWAQLALDTDIQHPLLPVIWQKFFTIYLERMRAEGGTLQRCSIGHRYFQSFADVAFLKRLKRQLARTADFHHNASQGHYPEGSRAAPPGDREPNAEGIVDGPGEREGGESNAEEGDDSEVQAGKEFHTNLLKLYQTYLLWLEEPLLHDASLYLPALPEQYDREKLSRIFNGDTEPWIEFVDWDVVNFGVNRLVTQWLHVTKPASYKSIATSARTYEIDAATMILNRLSQYDRPTPPPSVEDLVAPVGDIPRNILVDHRAMMDFIQGDLPQMLNYANSFTTRESYNVALDLSYVELFPTLYHNSEVETRLEIPCKTGIVSRHRCMGPARITVRHQEFKLSDSVKHKLDENRAEYNQLSIEMIAPPPPVICSAAVHIENAITDLINFCRTASGEEKDAIKQVGVALLYHLANQMNDDCRHYPPTRQFFTSCIEILGQEFVRPYPEQARPLLHEILTNQQLAGFLAPNFVPCNCPSTFVPMYTEVVRATANNMQDLAFMLLTKFDIGHWLERHRPTPTTASQLINVIGEALVASGEGEESDSRPLPHYEVYRSHLQAMFLYNFPQHYADIMRITIKGMEEKSLKLVILHDMLKTLQCPLLPDLGDIGQKQVEKLVQDETALSLNELRDSVEWLGNYFTRQRHTRPELMQFGLFSHWKDYMPMLSSFLGYLALNFVLQEATRLQETSSSREQGIKSLWELIVSFFSPWIAPVDTPSSSRPGVSQVNPAWSEGDVDSALVIVTLFTETTSFMQALLHSAQQPTANSILTMFWSYYTHSLSKKGLREDVLYAYHRAMSGLPWNEFYPDVFCMDSMIKMFEDRKDSCLLFLASIFPRIQWMAIVERLVASGNVQMINQFLSALLSMLIIFGNSTEIMQLQGSGMRVLIAEAHQLPWHMLDESCYHSATMWQLKKSNPCLVLEEQSVGTILSLMRSVAGIGSEEPPSPRLAAKQSAYIGLAVGLMCQSSQKRVVSGEQFTTPLHALLFDITIISTTAGPSAESMAHLSSLLSTVLSLLNGCSPITGAPDAIVRGLVRWLADCANSALVQQIINVACNTLASTKHMATITEACIDSYFATVSPLPNDSSHGWSGVVSVLQIPQLSHDEFLAQCLEGGAYLTLYAYLSQKLPQCRSLEEESAIQARIIEWCIACRPSRDNEYKVLLWWYKALELSTRMVSFGIPEWNVARSLNNLAPAIMALGEDRKSSGILGALGFGKQSQLSCRFRMAARSLATFIMAQLPREGVRMDAGAPGAIFYPAVQRSGRSSSTGAQQGMKLLDSSLQNRSYGDLKAITEYSRRFILDTRHCLPDALPFLSYLATALFPERASLNIIRQKNTNVATS